MGQERSDLRNRIKAVKSKVAAERLDEEQGVALSNALSQADRELAALKQQREPSVMLRDKLRQQQWEFGNHVQDAKNLIKKTNGRIAYVESHKGTVTEIEGLRSDVRTIAGGVAVVKTELQKISEQFNPTVTDSLISTVISLRVKVGDITEQLDPDTAGGLRSTVDSLGIAVGTLQKEFDVNESGSLAKRVFEVAEEVKTFKGQLDHTQTGSLAHSMKELKTDYDGIKDQLDPSTAGSFAANVTKLTTDLGKVEKQLDPAKANSLAKIVKTLQANYNTLNSQFNSTEPGSFAESFVKLVLDVQVLSAKQPLGGLIAKLAALEPKIESLTTNKSDRQTDLAALKIGVQTEQDVVIVDQRGLTALMQRVTDLARNVEVLESKLH
jgi:hypothetical protein